MINAAFNGGNSGGPIFTFESGEVIGVVISKLTPIPKPIAELIEGFSKGIYWLPGGQAPPIGRVFSYLFSQIQLVIGYAVTTEDLNGFLEAHGIKP